MGYRENRYNNYRIRLQVGMLAVSMQWWQGWSIHILFIGVNWNNGNRHGKIEPLYFNDWFDPPPFPSTSHYRHNMSVIFVWVRLCLIFGLKLHPISGRPLIIHVSKSRVNISLKWKLFCTLSTVLDIKSDNIDGYIISILTLTEK